MKTIEWLDNMVDAAENLRNVANNEYKVFLPKKEFQLLEVYFIKLIEKTQATVTYNPNWHNNYGEAYFMYRGYKFLSLWDKKGDKR